MLVFLDFEASSLGKRSYPIEVAWVFEDGRSEAHLIRPAPAWTDWDEDAEAIHKLSRSALMRDGTDHNLVATRMVETLSGHDLLASAPSWDGKWLSTLLRGAGLPRHSLRLRGSDAARRECASAILRPVISAERLSENVEALLEQCAVRVFEKQPAHRALADAEDDYAHWRAVRTAAEEVAVLQHDRTLPANLHA
ncbi:transcriptional regulator [Sphingomonas colocasiae]|uniref:Transcriptional regulator n=1 Tax=Sphingomonas colocasiae TaxID=1848973 RepID=A0ABS7PQ93_9SPHN|nr:transcriptional regulator [Sphingomonas colocasiae]MBY8823495.1 transcriptional regulator [Sphingomonas colocasiae]